MKFKLFGKEFAWGEKAPEQSSNLDLYPIYDNYNVDFFGLSNQGENQLNSYKSWVYACVTKIAQSVADIELELYKKKGDERDEVNSSPILDLLYGVNPYITFYDLVEMTVSYQELTGDAFWWLMKDGSGKPIQIIPFLRPDNMKVIPDSKDFIKGYLYEVPNSAEKIAFDKDEIIHFHSFNPTDFHNGFSPISAGDTAIETHKQLGLWNFNFFKNESTPRGLLMTESKLDRDQAERLKEAFESRHRGTDNAHRLAVLTGKNMSFQEVGMSIRDMDFATLKDKTRDEILAIYKTPKSVLGITDDVNRANAEATIAVWKEEVIVPKMKKFVNTLNEMLLPKFGEDDLFFDFENPVPRDVESDLKFYKEMFSIGALTPNEIRQAENLPPVAGGDSLYIPTMVQAIDAIAQDPTALQEAKKIKHFKHRRKTRDEKIQEVVAGNKELAQKAKALLKKRRKPAKKSNDRAELENLIAEAKKQKKELFWQNVWEIKVANTDIDERKMKTLLLPTFRRQEKQVLASLSQKDFGVNFDVGAEAKVIENKAKPFLKEIVQRYGLAAAALVGGETFDVNQDVQNYLKTTALEFATSINETTEDKIKKALAESVRLGEGVEEAKTRLQGVFSELKSSRAEKIVRTEIARADGFATVESFKQSGIKKKEWFTALDERVEPQCASMHGEIQDIGKNFSLGVPYEPLHVQCRCSVLPITGKDVNFELLGVKMAQLKERISKETQDIYDNAEEVVRKTDLMMKQTQERLEQLLQEDEQGQSTEKAE